MLFPVCCHNIITGHCQIILANAPDVNKFFFIREQKISENKAVHGSQTPVRVFPGLKASFLKFIPDLAAFSGFSPVLAAFPGLRASFSEIFTGLAAFPGLESIFFQAFPWFSRFPWS